MALSKDTSDFFSKKTGTKWDNPEEFVASQDREAMKQMVEENKKKKMDAEVTAQAQELMNTLEENHQENQKNGQSASGNALIEKLGSTPEELALIINALEQRNVNPNSTIMMKIPEVGEQQKKSA